MKNLNFKLTDSEVTRLKEFCSENGLKQCEAIRKGLDLLYDQREPTLDEENEKNQVKSDSKALDTLIKQLEIKDAQITEKDKQIARRDKQIDDLTESLRAAQALHAADKGLGKLSGGADAEPVVVPNQEETKPKWWQFWK